MCIRDSTHTHTHTHISPLISLLSLKLEPELYRRQGPTPDSHSWSIFVRAETVQWCVLSPQRTRLALLSCCYELWPGIGLPHTPEQIRFRDIHSASWSHEPFSRKGHDTQRRPNLKQSWLATFKKKKKKKKKKRKIKTFKRLRQNAF